MNEEPSLVRTTTRRVFLKPRTPEQSFSMSPSSQVKLLRVLQESAFRPVGGHLEISVDVRVIAATNRDLAQETATGRFRSDLFYRIAVLTINTPALQSR